MGCCGPGRAKRRRMASTSAVRSRSAVAYLIWLYWWAMSFSGLRSAVPYEDNFCVNPALRSDRKPELLTVVSTASMTVDGVRSFTNIIPAGYRRGSRRFTTFEGSMVFLEAGFHHGPLLQGWTTQWAPDDRSIRESREQSS